MAQTVFDINMPIALPGLVADAGVVQDTVSLLCEEAGGILAGLFVKGGTDPTTQAKLPTASTDITGLLTLGATMYDASKAPVSTGYANKEMIPVLRKGRIWCICDAVTITVGAGVFVRFAGGNAGRVRHDVDTANAAQLEGAVFRSTRKTITLQNGDTVDVALVELNLPVTA